MRLKQPLTKYEQAELLQQVEFVLVAATHIAPGLAPWAPRPDYIRPLKGLIRNSFVLDHLEGAQFFVAMYAYFFPGYGLRQELENAKTEKEMGTRWCYEPFDEEGFPIGVQLEEGFEAVFVGKSPYQAVVRMVWLLMKHGHCELIDIDQVKRADLVAPAALESAFAETRALGHDPDTGELLGEPLHG